MKLIIVYNTYPDIRTAKMIVKHLLKKRLIACAHILPAGESSYWWKGKIAKTKEVTSIAKSASENWPKILREVTRLHSYDVPCIVRFDATANTPFASWVRSETK